ncbi:MAG TPA: response regulator transcription factor [Candidatus Obscuribacterales bacterium]
MAKILIVEDETALVRVVEDYLSADHHQVEVATTGDDARTRLKSYAYDVVVLDWNLPGVAGIDILREFRERGGSTPVLMLTGKKEVKEKEAALDLGADDYLTKPFDGRELAARIRALLRRTPAVTGNVLKAGEYTLDRQNYKVTRGADELHLVPREFDLLEFFMRNVGRVYSSQALLNMVWSNESEATEEAVSTCVKRLRKKIDGDRMESAIRTIYGVGYKFEP